jgi:hypothetical protein
MNSAWPQVKDPRQNYRLHFLGCLGMLNFITHATGDNHTYGPGSGECDEALDKLIICR